MEKVRQVQLQKAVLESQRIGIVLCNCHEIALRNQSSESRWTVLIHDRSFRIHFQETLEVHTLRIRRGIERQQILLTQGCNEGTFIGDRLVIRIDIGAIHGLERIRDGTACNHGVRIRKRCLRRKYICAGRLALDVVI